MAILLFASCLSPQPATAETIETDVLIVGGTESGVAAAIQAARMGVKRITLVNDVDWLGGQFTAEALCAIDENRARGGTNETPFPRSGLFKELLDRIEKFNLQKYGHARPGNTVVASTCRPAEAEAIFHELVRPYQDSGQLRILSGYYPASAELSADKKTLLAITFAPLREGAVPLTVRAPLTIDASDWGEAIRAAGAEYETGPDLKKTYGEPNAPDSHAQYPPTEMNPITWCVLIEETDRDSTIAKPEGYDERRYLNATSTTRDAYQKLGWPKANGSAGQTPEQVYCARRLVDRHLPSSKATADVILLNRPESNYPLDVLPGNVVVELERIAPGASKKNIVDMTRAEREVIFADARRHALGFLYYLQTAVHDRLQPADQRWSLRKFKLSEEFRTPDGLPPKPYIRESLRLRALHMMAEQETLNDNHRDEFARVMYGDGVGSWQFEYDFHPTGREFLPSEGPSGAWESYGKRGRGWGVYSHRAVLPLRSLIPIRVNGLLGAQKNLGFSSQVCSAVRLHDQSMMVGQAAGATAAVCTAYHVTPRTIPTDAKLLAEVRAGLCKPSDDDAIPLSLWPFADLKPTDESYVPVNQLAARGALPLSRAEVEFKPNEPATPEWRSKIVELSMKTKRAKATPAAPAEPMSRGEFARRWWQAIKDLPDAPFDATRSLIEN